MGEVEGGEGGEGESGAEGRPVEEGDTLPGHLAMIGVSKVYCSVSSDHLACQS